MKRIRPLSDKEFKDIYSKITKLVVVMVIKNEKGILLTLRKKNGWVGKWHLPGGIVQFCESIDLAINRISNEELGVDCSKEQLLGYIEYFSEIAERGFGYTVGLVFSVKTESYNFKLDDDAEEANFFSALPQNMLQEEKDFLNNLK